VVNGGERANVEEQLMEDVGIDAVQSSLGGQGLFGENDGLDRDNES